MNRSKYFIALTAAAVVIMALDLAPAASTPMNLEKPAPVPPVDQEAAWERLRAMVGVWKGPGEPGSSRVEQRYQLIVQDKFLHVHTKSVSPSDNHEDWEIFSFDGIRKKVVLRQFVSEGFITRFVLNRAKDDGRTLIFLSEACENAPRGFRARQTLTFETDDRISQELELAPSGKKYSRCAANTLTRQK